MLANQDVIVVGPRVVLVPYRPEHVATYHGWMASPELQELTASEPLSLQEEYDMQEKWRLDEDKLTFIIHARTPELGDNVTAASVLALPMVGDVNLFLKGDPTDEDFEVEAEIMVAEPAYRRKGMATEALHLLLWYATTPSIPSEGHISLARPPLPLPRDRLVVRIGASNAPSIALFEALGFKIVRRVEVFDEFEMRLARGDVASQDATKESIMTPGWTAGVVRTVSFHS